MKFVIALFIGATAAVKLQDGPAFFAEPPYTETSPSAAGFVQVTACAASGATGVTCGPSDVELFATGMNGDEDLAEDITMKGDKFHYVQQGFTPVKVESTEPLPKCHGNNGADTVNCAREVCSGTNGPKDGPTGTPCTKEEPADIPHYNTDPEAGRPYQTTGDATNTSPAGYAGDVHRMPDYSAVAIRGDDLSAPEKVSVTDPKIAKSHTTFYNKQ